MRSRLVLLALALIVLAGCGGGQSDSESARCNSPQTTFDRVTDQFDHKEVAVHFTCEGAVLAGTLYLPTGEGRHPAVVWVHGSGEQPRLNYGDVVAPLVQNGIAVFSYDKRGVGESEGECCPSGHYNLLAADADGAVMSLRARDDIDPARVGFYGASEAGWVVPLADALLSEPVAFTALVDAPSVTTGEEEAWSEAAGEEEPGPLTAEKKAGATRALEKAGPSGFDPAPYIARMQTPGLWLYGGADKSIPTERCVTILERLKNEGRDFTIEVFPDAGHGLADTPPTAPEAPIALVRWIEETVEQS